MIRDQIKKLRKFDVIRYAQKAASNIHILRLMRQEGLLVDAVSAGELQRSLTAGFTARDIVYTVDLIDSETLLKVLKQGVAINVGSIDMLERIGASAPAEYPIWLRVNPGFGHGHSNKTNTGGDHSKHGLWLSDLPQAIKMLRHYNFRLIGLHMHIGSGADYLHLSKVCGAMVQLVKDLGCDIRATSACQAEEYTIMCQKQAA